MALAKESILSAYRDLVKANEGRAIGERVFARETGISRYYWQGGHWRSWSELQAEAGHVPNLPNQKTPDDVVLRRFAELALKRGELPRESDLMVERKEDPTFPNKTCFRRWGDRHVLLAKVNEYCQGHDEFTQVVQMLTEGGSADRDQRFDSFRIKGFVYLLRSGNYYKIGRSNAVGRRLRELAIQLPQKPNTVHIIETDDPEGIEEYWHKRFADRRHGGEWFALNSEDVRAFKKRRFQ